MRPKNAREAAPEVLLGQDLRERGKAAGYYAFLYAYNRDAGSTKRGEAGRRMRQP